MHFSLNVGNGIVGPKVVAVLMNRNVVVSNQLKNALAASLV
jgi:hypothetical protein